jgi:hypothetical protein
MRGVAMAGFRMHITTSTLLGFGYGAVGYWYLGMPPDTAMLGTCFCSVAGMLPDLDSDSGTPLRESVAFAAAVVPMLLIDRFQQLQLRPATMVLAGALVYLLIRFGVAAVLKRFTVHRGMFHSFPAMAIVATLGYLITGSAEMYVRYFHSAALALGFLSHLVLDEIYSVDMKHARLKSSFGTAMKFIGPELLPNLVTYGLLALVGFAAFGDPIAMDRMKAQIASGYHEQVEPRGKQLERTASQAIERLWH